MAEVEIWTYSDAVEHVLDVYDLERTARNLRQAKRAILAAYNNLPNLHRWSYYTRKLQLVSEASQTGTAVYDHTGGAYERMVTLDSGTWPANAARGRVVLNNIMYDIDERKSSTIVTLTEGSNPGADVASTSYIYFRSAYELPVSYRAGYELLEIANGYSLSYLSPPEMMERYAGAFRPSRPYAYTIHGTGDFYGRVSLEFVPPPSEARTYDFMCELSPRQLRFEKVRVGTVSVAAGATAVTGATTSFTSDMVGSIIRFSSNSSDLPSGPVGSAQPDPNGIDTPYYEQRVITAVASSTACTIDEAVSATVTLTDVKYEISDPIDVEPSCMINLFWRMCEREFARLIRADDEQDREIYVQRELINSMGADNRNRDLGRTAVPRWSLYRKLADWAVIQS